MSGAGSQGGRDSWHPVISPDGRYVTFDSDASNLVPGDHNDSSDVFLYDRIAGTIERVSLTSEGMSPDYDSFAPSMSADGRYVAFTSFALNLFPGADHAYIYGRIYVRDRVAGTTELISRSSAGAPGNDDSGVASISAYGRYVAFDSYATNLVPSDTNQVYDVFLRDRVSGTTEWLSVNSAGAEANGGIRFPAISADGRVVSFASDASNLVPDDTNGVSDAFVSARMGVVPVTVTLAGSGSGTVTSSPAGIACPSACQASFPPGASVILTAVPAVGSSFAGWSGACAGTGSCALSATTAQALTALPPPHPPRNRRCSPSRRAAPVA